MNKNVASQFQYVKVLANEMMEEMPDLDFIDACIMASHVSSSVNMFFLSKSVDKLATKMSNKGDKR